MNNMPFKNYEEFKELFGMRETSDGKLDRKNKILLSYYKCKELRSLIQENYPDIFASGGANPRDMGQLFTMCDRLVYESIVPHANTIRIMGRQYRSTLYTTDGRDGICVDGDIRAYRYERVSDDRIFKMKIGKMYKHLILETKVGKLFPEPVLLWMCEEMTRRWETYVVNNLPGDDTVLHVDDNFYAIYDGDRRCVGDFGSCMSGGHHSKFYKNATDAKAAYLTNGAGGIIARCVIFTDVIDGGYIDGYKRVGAGCHEASAFVTNSGESLSDKVFRIRMDLDSGDVLSYQDSFKWYDRDENLAYNSDDCCYTDELDCTDDYFDYDDDESEWDSWHERYADAVVTVYCGSTEYTCDEDDLDEFTLVENGAAEGEYHHNDDVTYCEDLDDYVINDDASYSELLDEYYYDVSEMRAAEKEVAEKRGLIWSEHDEEWLPEEEVTAIRVAYRLSGEWEDETISKVAVDNGLRRNIFTCVAGILYTQPAYDAYLNAHTAEFAFPTSRDAKMVFYR